MEKQGPPPAQVNYGQAPPPQQPGYGAPPPGYPGAPPPQGYAAQPQGYPNQPVMQQPPPQQTTVIVANTNMPMSESPMNMTCPHCQANIVTRVDYKTGMLTWLVVGGLCLLGCWFGCCLIPLCIDGLKDVEHFCPNCNRMIGTKRKL